MRFNPMNRLIPIDPEVTQVTLFTRSRVVAQKSTAIFCWAFGENFIFENCENVVAVARVGDSGNLRQNFATTFAPNGP
jgi:hypothetical protein